VNFSRLPLGIGLTVVLAIATATAGLAQFGANPEVPLPPATPAPVVTATPAVTAAPVETASPGPTPSGGPRRGQRAPGPAASGSPSAAPSETPEPPQFTTLDGVWEIELQPQGHRLATYTHIYITATGADLTGYWLDTKKNKLPLTGTFDGRLISMTATMPDGTTATFSGYVESFGDMVGLMRTSDKDPGTAFTGEHRKKLKG
jgi:hypothetical protein